MNTGTNFDIPKLIKVSLLNEGIMDKIKPMYLTNKLFMSKFRRQENNLLNLLQKISSYSYKCLQIWIWKSNDLQDSVHIIKEVRDEMYNMFEKIHRDSYKNKILEYSSCVVWKTPKIWV